MSGLDQELEHRLEGIRGQGLFRRLRSVKLEPGARIVVDNRLVLDCASNDYLGLAAHPVVIEAAVRAANEHGAGSRAARLICGSISVHGQLEESIARFEQAEAALTFSSGYTTALGTIPALVGAGDVVAIDKRVHACLVDGARLSGARLRVFRHNDLERLSEILRWADQRALSSRNARRSRTLVVTESVFSMDGDHAPLHELVELKDRYGAWLMIDEAHATGLYGSLRTGLAEALGVAHRIEVRMGTLGKALGAAGGFVCGSFRLVDYLVNKARSFIFSTAPPPAVAAAATASLALVAGEEGRDRCARLWANVAAVSTRLRRASDTGTGAEQTAETVSAIVPLIVGDESRAMAAAATLLDNGVFIPAVRYPTVPRGAARLRLTLTAAHTTADIVELLAALEAAGFTGSAGGGSLGG